MAARPGATAPDRRADSAKAVLAGLKPDERRFAGRRQRSLPAYILSDRLTAAVPCIVRDLSSTGAKLELVLGRDTPVTSVDGLSDDFVLYVMVDEVEMDCAVAWRRGTMIGVRFTGIARHRPRRTSTVRRPRR